MGNVVGFDDEDEDEKYNQNENVLTDCHRICEYIYFCQISLFYAELFNVLRIELSHWNSNNFNGIVCKLKLDAIAIHAPCLDNDIVLRFVQPHFIKNDASKCWNKLLIEIQNENTIDVALSDEIEHCVLDLLFSKWKRQSNESLFVDDTLRCLKNEQTQSNAKRKILNLRGRIGKFEQNEGGKENEQSDIVNSNGDGTECELLEFIANKIIHRRLANEMKKILILFSKQNGAFGVKWNQFNAISIVAVSVSIKGKLLCDLTLNGIYFCVKKYKNKKTKTVPCSSIDQLRQILNSFVK